VVGESGEEAGLDSSNHNYLHQSVVKVGVALRTFIVVTIFYRGVSTCDCVWSKMRVTLHSILQ